MVVDAALDTALVALSCTYAEWLAEHKELEPNWTFIEVGAGVGYCLLHAYLRGGRRGGDWRAGQGEILRSLVMGGTPIVIGELAQWIQRREKFRRLREKWG